MNVTHARAALAASTWRKASASQGANACVEVATVTGWAGIRDSKLGSASPMLTVGAAQWDALRCRLQQR